MGNLRLLTSLQTAQPYCIAPTPTSEVWAWKQSLRILLIQGEHTERQTGKGLRRSFGPTPAQGMGEARQSEMISLLSTTTLPRQVQSKESSSSSGWKDNGENENSVKRLDGAGRSKALKKSPRQQCVLFQKCPCCHVHIVTLVLSQVSLPNPSDAFFNIHRS